MKLTYLLKSYLVTDTPEERNYKRGYNEAIKYFEKNHTNIMSTVVTGWKGESGIKAYKEGLFWVLKEVRKDKNTGKCKELIHRVPEQNVKKLWAIMQDNMLIGKDYTCYDIARWLGYSKWGDLWKERKTYFEIYYYPLKVFEGNGMIAYESKSRIRRIC